MKNKQLLASTVFLSAFLLFLVQPMVAKRLLPQLGGSSAVWATCLMFFQVVLLLGYVYAHALHRWLKPRRQALVHTLVLLLALFVFPIEIDARGQAQAVTEPGLRVLLLLLVSIGLPYGVLASTGPLLQSLFAGKHPGTDVYRLYSISNLASLLALLCYPFTLERWLPVQQQLVIWSFGYGLFTLLCLASVWRYASEGAGGALVSAAPPPGSDAPTLASQLQWVLFAALATALLVATTANITLNIASIPLFWILPLAVYLLSFVLTFGSQRWYSHRLAVLPMMVLPLLMLLTWRSSPEDLSLSSVIGINVLGLLACCWFLHGELSARKPAPRYLTRFYLLVSLGGALGGVFGSVLAPLLLSGFHELQLLLVLVPAAALWVLRRYLNRNRAARLVGLMFAVSVALCGLLGYSQWRQDRTATTLSVRNFYAVSSVKERVFSDQARKRSLYNGSILHGSQIVAPPPLAGLPGDYYGPASGVAMALDAAAPGSRQVGVIGLGAGVLAAYSRPGDHYRFFEINPQSVQIAREQFDYLRQSKGRVDIVEGDARIVLEHQPEPPPAQRFDVLVVDAFSGDAIPMHLLTLEAFRVYLSHLADGGVLALHISNKYLDLRGVLAAASEALGLQARWVSAKSEGEHQFGSEWVLMTRHIEAHQGSRWAQLGKPLRSSGPAAAPAWTDARNNLLDAMAVHAWH